MNTHDVFKPATVVTCFVLSVMLFAADTVCPQTTPAAKPTQTVTVHRRGFVPEAAQVPGGSNSKENEVIMLLKEQNKRLKEENAQLKAEIAALKAGN